ncbi:MAG: hypothetical protein JXB26_04730 [Candidatus Aminicenantes bacterium]|nr:hypothetical protein [Candidatus Aminicenantes bacterium]
MKILFAFGVLILVSFLGARFLFRKRASFSPISYFFFSGMIYIFFGLFLGRFGVKVLTGDVLKNLDPLVHLCLGWVGFIFGFQFEYKYIRRFPQKYVGLSFLQSLFIIVLVSVSFCILLPLLYAEQDYFMLYGMAIAMGLLLSLSSPSLINFFSRRLPSGGNYCYLARFLSGVNGFWGVLGMSLIISFWHYPFFSTGITTRGLIFLVVSVLFPVFLGYLFHFLTMGRSESGDLLVFLLGMVFFAAGAATYFHLSSLFVCMILGVTYSNLTSLQGKIYPLLISTEKPFYIVFLIFIGAMWEFTFDLKIGLIVFILVGLRIAGFLLPLRFFGRLLKFPFPVPARFGLCFFSSGGIALAFIVSFKLLYPLEMTNVFVSAAILATIAGEFLGPWGLKKSILILDEKR